MLPRSPRASMPGLPLPPHVPQNWPIWCPCLQQSLTIALATNHNLRQWVTHRHCWHWQRMKVKYWHWRIKVAEEIVWRNCMKTALLLSPRTKAKAHCPTNTTTSGGPVKSETRIFQFWEIILYYVFCVISFSLWIFSYSDMGTFTLILYFSIFPLYCFPLVHLFLLISGGLFRCNFKVIFFCY